LLAFIASATVASAVFNPGVARAVNVYFSAAKHAISCRSNSPVTINSSGQVANTSAAPIGLFCPVDSSTDHDPSTWSFVTLTGYSHGGTGPVSDLYATACSTWIWGGGGECGAVAFAPAAPVIFDLDVSAEAWNKTAHAKYLFVSLGGQRDGSSNVIWRYVVNETHPQ
jgi:hypothetical protein